MIRTIIFSLFLLVLPIWTSATGFITPDGVTKSQQDGITTLSAANEQIPIIVEKKDLPTVFERIELSNSDYSGPAFFIWQPTGQALDPGRFNMGLNMVHGTILLPAKINRENIEMIGVIIPASTITFRDILIGNMTFSDKWKSLISTHNGVLPSTINLINGKSWGTTPITKILGIFLLILLAIAYFSKRTLIFPLLISFWILWDIGYAYDQFLIIKKANSLYISPASTQKNYYDLGNIPEFAKSSRKFAAKNIDFYAPRNWPYYINFLYHAYPSKTYWQGTGSELVAVSRVPITLSGDVLTIGQTVLPGKYTLLEQFSEDSYIFKKQ